MPRTVSWIRAYHTRLDGKATDVINRLAAGGMVRPSDDVGIGFFDVQALRSAQFASGNGPRLQLTYGSEQFVVRTRVLAHVSGFLVLRLTLASADNPVMRSMGLDELARFERLPWGLAQLPWSWGSETFNLGVRETFNLIYLRCHELLRDRTWSLAAATEQAVDGNHGNAHFHRLCERNELSYPFPVTFGTVFELSNDTAANEVGAFLREISGGRDVAAAQVSSLPWYLFENSSVILCGGDFDEETSAGAPLQASLMEFVTLQRGALRSTQRDTQRVMADGQSVSRRRIEEWQVLLATTTDDYVLHDQVSRFLVPMREHFRHSHAVRDPGILEDQVRRNIASFQSRIELAGQSASTIIGALFAVVACVVGLSGILKAATAKSLSVKVSDLPDTHPWLSSGVDLTVTLLAFVVTWALIRRASMRIAPLKPFRTGPMR